MLTRVLTGTDIQVDQTFYVDGVATDLDSNPTVTATKPDGTVVSGSVSNPSGTGNYRWTSDKQANPTELTLTWVGTISGADVQLVSEVQVVSAFYFSLGELKALPGLGNKTAAQLDYARLVAEHLVEDVTERAWVERYVRQTYDGDGSSDFLLDPPGLPVRRLLSCKVDGTAQTITSWTVTRTGRVRTGGTSLSGSTTTGQDIVFEYTYGEERPPADLKRAALMFARHVLLDETSAIPDRARMMTTEFATFQLTMADAVRYPTGLPEVDAVLNRYRTELPVFA